MKTNFLSAILVCGALSLPSLQAFAVEKETTIESTVTVEKTDSPTTERIIKITGPDKVVYRIDAPAEEVEHIATIVRDKPRTVISFNGEATDENGDKVFKLQKWEKVRTTTTKSTTDVFGNKSVEESTETHTERVP